MTEVLEKRSIESLFDIDSNGTTVSTVVQAPANDQVSVTTVDTQGDKSVVSVSNTDNKTNTSDNYEYVEVNTKSSGVSMVIKVLITLIALALYFYLLYWLYNIGLNMNPRSLNALLFTMTFSVFFLVIIYPVITGLVMKIFN